MKTKTLIQRGIAREDQDTYKVLEYFESEGSLTEEEEELFS